MNIADPCSLKQSIGRMPYYRWLLVLAQPAEPPGTQMPSRSCRHPLPKEQQDTDVEKKDELSKRSRRALQIKDEAQPGVKRQGRTCASEPEQKPKEASPERRLGAGGAKPSGEA